MPGKANGLAHGERQQPAPGSHAKSEPVNVVGDVAAVQRAQRSEGRLHGPTLCLQGGAQQSCPQSCRVGGLRFHPLWNPQRPGSHSPAT